MTIVLKAQSRSGTSRRDAILKKIEQKKRGTGRAFNIANKAVANFLLDKSREIVPILSKDLYNSSRVKGTGRGFNNVQEVSYNMPYALRQHQDLSYSHKPGKSALFLTGPAMKFRSEMQRIMIDTTAKYTKGGGGVR